MDIKKAVITAAGPNQRSLPLQTLIGRDGRGNSALGALLEEVKSAGIDEVCVIVAPGDHAAYRSAAGDRVGRLEFIEQPKPLGYGAAVACARPFVGNDPFLLLVSDHLYVSRGQKSCAQQLVEVARAEECCVSAVQATHESKLPYYGTVGGRIEPGRPGLFKVETVLEKVTPTVAEQQSIVPGLRAGHYLCFFGMHVLTPTLMEILGAQVSAQAAPATLSSALASLAGRERYLAYELQGRRYDIGARYGLFIAQLAFALEGPDREEVLAQLLELLAHRAR